MQEPFSEEMTNIAESMGVALYQRFSMSEAALFLRCPLQSLEKLVAENGLEYIQVTSSQVEFFGYQLLQHLLASIRGLPSRQPKVDENEPERMVGTAELQELTGLSRTTIWRLERKGEFPSRVPLSTGRIGWRMSDVVEWMASR